ncbi:MAG: hypothetical protein AB1529_05465 [Candidatus Micrarchaeota archaeon]
MPRISMEREFSLWKEGRPLHRGEMDRFRSALESRAAAIGISCIDREVAHNSVEVKFSLIDKASFADKLSSLRAGVEDISGSLGVRPCWTNQPAHAYPGHNEYFTTLAFPGTVDALVHANSLHVHFETPTEVAVHAYRQMNALAPWFMTMSSMLGGGRGRLEMTGTLAREFGELILPQDFRSMADFSDFMERMSLMMRARMAREGTEAAAMAMFPRMFPDGGPLTLTPDKLFSPARIRPDLRLENGNISVEFRAIDAIASLEEETHMVGLAIAVYERVASGMSTQQGIAEARGFLLGLSGGIGINPPTQSYSRKEGLEHELVPATAA